MIRNNFNNSRLIKQLMVCLFQVIKYYANIKCYCRKILNGMEIYAISEWKDYKSEYKKRLGGNPPKYQQ